MIPNKALLSLVIGMGVVILAMLGAVGYGILQRSGDAGRGSGVGTVTAGPDLTVAIPPGSSIASVERSGELLLVHVVDEEDRSTVLFIDPTDGRIVRRIAFSTRAPSAAR